MTDKSSTGNLKKKESSRIKSAIKKVGRIIKKILNSRVANVLLGIIVGTATFLFWAVAFTWNHHH